MSWGLQNDKENEKTEVVVLAETAQIIDGESLDSNSTSLGVFTFILVGHLFDEHHVLDLFTKSASC